MIYYTGDIHGGKHEIVHFTKRMNLTVDDVIVILGEEIQFNIIYAFVFYSSYTILI